MTTATIEVLTATERDELTAQETIIEHGFKEFVAVGLALAKVRDGRLYRESYPDFKTYVSERWDVGKSRAYQLMDAAEIVQDLSTNGGTIPLNERQARALKVYPPELRPVILETVKNHGAPITAERIEAMGDVLLEIEQTGGYVTTPDGRQSAAAAAYGGNRGEQEKVKNDSKNILDTSASLTRRFTQDDGDYLVFRVGKGMAANVTTMRNVRLVLKTMEAA